MTRAGLEAVWERLVRNALAQPQVVVHRDFHSRNLMCLADGALGVIDFQDAVIGPITYDLASLLKDCYVVWPRDTQLAWLRSAYDGLAEHHFATGASFTDFVGWFDLMGLQRHIKVLGIFARLCLRDNKPQYLGDLPRVLAYVLAALNLYRDTEPALAHFADWFEAEVMPIASAQSWFTADEKVAHMKAMILAAGRGERMLPLTKSTPKAPQSCRGDPARAAFTQTRSFGISRGRDKCFASGGAHHCLLRRRQSLGPINQFVDRGGAIGDSRGIARALPLGR